jgi:hypothetical protein
MLRKGRRAAINTRGKQQAADAVLKIESLSRSERKGIGLHGLVLARPHHCDARRAGHTVLHRFAARTPIDLQPRRSWLLHLIASQKRRGAAE